MKMVQQRLLLGLMFGATTLAQKRQNAGRTGPCRILRLCVLYAPLLLYLPFTWIQAMHRAQKLLIDSIRFVLTGQHNAESNVFEKDIF